MRIRKNAMSLLSLRQASLLIAFSVLIFVSIFSGGNFIAVLSSWITNFVPLLFLSIAASLIISSGHVDISTGSVMSLLGMLLVFWVGVFGFDLKNVILAHILAISVGVIIYFLVFTIISRNVSSLIITLAVFFIAKGLSTFLQACLQGAGVICRSHGTGFLISTSGILPSNYVLHILASPIISGIVAILLVLIVNFWRFHTRMGLEHVAVGLNQVSAKFAGVSTRKVHFIAFLMAGFLVGLATIVRLHGQTHGGWSANTGWGEELLAIAIAVIGGTRITGGYFDPFSVSLAALVIYAMRDVVTNDLNLPSEMASIAFGIVMAIVVWFDSRNQRE